MHACCGAVRLVGSHGCGELVCQHLQRRACSQGSPGDRGMHKDGLQRVGCCIGVDQ